MIEVHIDGYHRKTPIQADKTLLDTLLDSGINVPFSCKAGHCSFCVCKLESGQVDIKDDSILTKKEKEEGFILACQSKALTDEIVLNYDY